MQSSNVEVFDWQKNTNAYQRIIHLLDLEDKWDGYAASKFSKEQVDLALISTQISVLTALIKDLILRLNHLLLHPLMARFYSSGQGRVFLLDN